MMSSAVVKIITMGLLKDFSDLIKMIQNHKSFLNFLIFLFKSN